MVMINTSLVDEVKGFLDGGDRGFLTRLREAPRDDIESQAVVRYLMQIKHWPFTPDSDFSAVLDHLFAEYPERKKLDPTEYQATTATLIKESFGYECIVVVPEPRPVVEAKAEKTRKPARKPKTTEEVVETSDVDTEGASDRLKRVIAIQRGS